MSTSSDINRIIDQIEIRLPLVVTPSRFTHIQGVVATALDLAQRFQVDEDRVRLAAIAHDMERDRTDAILLAYAADWRVPLSAYERRVPKLAHGPVAAARLYREYGVVDTAVLDAVRHHTLGHPVFLDQPDPIGLVLYVADFCEPGRKRPFPVLRAEILSLNGLEEMTSTIIRESRQLFGPLEEPTERLYARLNGDNSNGT